MAYKTGQQRAQSAVDNGSSWASVSPLIYGGAARLIGNVPNDFATYVDVTELKIIVAGVVNATDKQASAPAAGSVNFSPTNWGAASLTVAQLKAADFGFRFKYNTFSSVDIKGFDFSLIPDNATITDIKLNYGFSVNNIGGGDATFDMILSSVEVTFTYPAILSASGWNEGLLVADNPNPKPIESKLRYSAFDKNRNFLGEYTRVIGSPSVKNNINTLHSSFSLDLGQNDLTEEEELAEVINESGDNVITEEGANWLASLTTPVAIGEDTNMDTNIEVDISVAYGQWLPWLTEDGDEIITEDNKLIILADGAPDGRKIFGGYISNWELQIGGRESVAPNLLSHSQELNNILFTTQDTPTGYGYLNSNGYIGLRSQLVGGTAAIGQSFTVSGGTKTISGIALWIKCNQNTIATVTMRTGGAPNGGTIIAVGTKSMSPNLDYQLTYILFDEPVSLTDATQYTFTVESSEALEMGKGSSGLSPLQVAADWNAGMSGGAGKWESYPYFVWSDGVYDDKTGTAYQFDLKFQLYQAGGATKFTMNSVDPSFALKEVLRFAQSRGSRVQFTDQTIEMTNTVVSLEFNANSADEAIDICLKSMPSDWFIWYDPATDEVHAHARPEETEYRQILRKRHTVGVVRIRKTIEKLVNDVLFSGGDIGGGVNLLIRESDADSISTIRRGLLKMSDSRVKVEQTARLMIQAEIDRGRLPIFSGTATLVKNDDFYLEDVLLGELQKLGNFSTIVNGLPALQVVSLNYKVETVDVEWNLLLPKVSKRIEDIRRNLALQEMENNPTSPS